jgi:hypothetical protein
MRAILSQGKFSASCPERQELVGCFEALLIGPCLLEASDDFMLVINAVGPRIVWGLRIAKRVKLLAPTSSALKELPLESSPAQSGRVALGLRVVALGTAVVAPTLLIGAWSLNVLLASGSVSEYSKSEKPSAR